MKITKPAIILCFIGLFITVIGFNMDTSNFRGNSSFAQDIYEMTPALLASVGIISIMLGIFGIIVQKNQDKKPIVIKLGKVIEKENSQMFDFLIVEFDDGTRKRISASKHLAISVGDSGTFHIKGIMLEKFFKN